MIRPQRRGSRRRLLVLLGLAAAGAGVAAALGVRAADSPEDLRRRKGELAVVERKAETDPAASLALASELARAGDGLYAMLFSRGWATGPAIRSVTAEGAGRVARAIAGREILRGEGLPADGSRYVAMEHARAKAAGERVPGSQRDFYEQRLALFARAAGLGARPKDLHPVCLESGPGGRVRADAAGFGLLAAVRLAADLAGPRRSERGTTYVGSAPEAGFEGLALLHAATAKLQALRSQFVYDGKAFVEASLIDYDPFASPRYFPHEVKMTGDGGAPVFEAADPRSHLADEAAILLGACEYARLKDRGPGTASLFGSLKDGGDVRDEIFPVALASSAKEVARFAFRNLAALHFEPRPARQTFVSEATIDTKGARVATADAALAILALESVVETFGDDARIRAEARKLLQAQAGFLLARERPDGSLAAAFEIAGEAPVEAAGVPAPLATEALAVQAYLAAARVTGEDRYQAAALRLARSIEARRYDPWAGLYLGPDPAAETTLGPADAGFMLGTLRDLAIEAKTPAALERFREFYQALAKAGAFESGGEATMLRLKVARP